MAPKIIPVNLMAVEVGPKEESMAIVSPAVRMAIGNRAGAGKMRSLIPKKRMLVKTMMYHSIKGFVKSLFFPRSSVGDGAGVPP